MVPGETVSFVFPRVLCLGKHQDSRENRTNCFPWNHTLTALLYILDFPFNSHSKRKKPKTDRATTAELHPGQDTFVFDQESTNHSPRFVK